MDSNHPIALKHVHRRRAWHETRRAEALERQRTQRQVSIDHARRLGDVGGLVEDNTPQVTFDGRLYIDTRLLPATAPRIGYSACRGSTWKGHRGMSKRTVAL